MDNDIIKKKQFLGKKAGEFLREAIKDGYDANELIDMAIALSMSIMTVVYKATISDDMSSDEKTEVAKNLTYLAMMRYGKTSEEELRNNGVDIEAIDSFYQSGNSKRK